VSDLKISELPQLAGANLAANDLLAVADTSASETRSITISDGIGKAVTLIADDTIPSAKILFAAGSVPGSAIEGETVNTSQIANDAVNAAKLSDNSVTRLVSTLPATGDFAGQFALDTDDLKLFCWDGSTWQAIKAGGSVNTVIGGSAGVVNVTHRCCQSVLSWPNVRRWLRHLSRDCSGRSADCHHHGQGCCSGEWQRSRHEREPDRH